MFSSINRHILIPACVIGWLTLISAGGIPVLQAFPPAANIDFSEKYRQLLLQAKAAPSKMALKDMAFEAINACQAAIQAGDYPAAVKIATLAVKIGKSAGSNHAFTLANSLRQRSVMLSREYIDVEKYHQKLKEDPNDASAASLYGKFVALKLNNWKEGLFWLSRGDDAAYRTLAKQEIAAADNVEKLPAVADGWYQLAQQEKGLTVQELERHAYDLYSSAWTKMIGADQIAIGNKLSEMPLRYLTHMQEQDVVHGAWPFGKNGDPGNGGMITVNQIEFPRGLGMVPPSRGSASVSYQLDGQYKTFVSGIAFFDDDDPFGGNVTFTVLGDNRVLWKSPLKDQKDVLYCKVSVRNVKRLEIRTETRGINRGAHTGWLDPHVLK